MSTHQDERSLPPLHRRVCVFCASSTRIHPAFHAAAAALGRLLALDGSTVVYGGGRVGSMGALADAALAEGGSVVGIIPRFMVDLEWAHEEVELDVVEDMHARKRKLVAGADAVVALPGGSGTLEELFEVVTMKRLGLFTHPIVLLNMRGYYDPLLQQLASAIEEGFMHARHADMWTVVERAEDVLPAIDGAAAWDEDARSFAAL